MLTDDALHELTQVPHDQREWHRAEADRIALYGPLTQKSLELLQDCAYLRSGIRQAEQWIRRTRGIASVELSDRRAMQRQIDAAKIRLKAMLKELRSKRPIVTQTAKGIP